MANQKTDNVEIKDESQDQEKPASSSSSKKAKKIKEEIPGLVLNANGEEEYKVERIVTKKLIDGVVHYRIKWVGWESKYNTWEPIDNLSNCLEMVTEFEATYQMDGNGAVKKGRGRPVKLRPPVKPGHDTFFNAEEEMPNVETETAEATDDDNAVNEYLDKKFMGPMFRRVWKESEIPLCVLGSNIINGALVHLVRIKVKDEVEASVLEDPYEGLTDNNCVMVLAQTFNCHFPQMVLEYFENSSKFVKGVAPSEDIVTKAARIELLRLCRTQGVYCNQTKLFNDILETTQTDAAGDSTDSKQSGGLGAEKVGSKMTSSFSFSHFSSTSKKNESTSELDKFGLPPDTSSSDSDTEEEIIKDFKQNRIKKSVKRRIESDEEEEAVNPKVEEAVNPNVEEAVNPNVKEAVNPKVVDTDNPKEEEAVNPKVVDTDNPKVEEAVNPKVVETDNPKVEDADNRKVAETDDSKMEKEQKNDAAMVNLTVAEDEDSDLETIVDQNYALNAEVVKKFKNSLDNEDESELLDWGDLDSDALEID
ncbi:unnamed protein product [Orchesella dallaii]|uniref:Chromo domain-containing protein n=1 Tax=Orchesella dallaii TaxID=48710 RepID=A0ABP1RBI8_9HEXA